MKIFRSSRTLSLVVAMTAGIWLAASPAMAAGETLKDLGWLTGTWLESREDGAAIEVTWSAPRGDAMVGTWRMIRGGELRAYEILTMRQTDEGIFYRFDLYRKAAMFVGPKSTSFKLAEAGDKRVVFDLVGGSGQISIEITEEGRLRGAWSDPEQPELPPAVGYDATRVE